MHGGPPRVRRRRMQTGQEAEPDTKLHVNVDKILSTIVTSALGGIAGGIATRAIFNERP